MEFNLIDKNTWARSECFTQYIENIKCTYSMTSNIDITELLKYIKDEKLKLYPVLIYISAKIVNNHEEFRMSLDDNGNLGFYSEMNPCYTIFHKDTETFSNLWSEYSNDFKIFYNNYLNDIKKYGDLKRFKAKENEPKNVFPISCVPWVSFTGFNLNVSTDMIYLLPILTFGKYFEQNGRILLPLSIQVHHAVCDGFHTSRFINEFTELAKDYLMWIR